MPSPANNVLRSFRRVRQQPTWPGQASQATGQRQEHSCRKKNVNKWKYHVSFIKSSLRDNLAQDKGNLLDIVGSCRLHGDWNPLIRGVLKGAAHASDLHDERNRSASDGLGCSASEDGGRHVENCLKDVFFVVCKLEEIGDAIKFDFRVLKILYSVYMIEQRCL